MQNAKLLQVCSHFSELLYHLSPTSITLELFFVLCIDVQAVAIL